MPHIPAWAKIIDEGDVGWEKVQAVKLWLDKLFGGRTFAVKI